MILVTIALALFMCGTILTLLKKKPKFIWLSFISAYIFLIIGLIGSPLIHMLLMFITLALNIVGLYESERSDKNENI